MEIIRSKTVEKKYRIKKIVKKEKEKSKLILKRDKIIEDKGKGRNKNRSIKDIKLLIIINDFFYINFIVS